VRKRSWSAPFPYYPRYCVQHAIYSIRQRRTLHVHIGLLN